MGFGTRNIREGFPFPGHYVAHCKSNLLSSIQLNLEVGEALGSCSGFTPRRWSAIHASVGFGGERADLGWMPFGNTDLDCERPVVNRDHRIRGLGVGVGPFCAIGSTYRSAVPTWYRAKKQTVVHLAREVLPLAWLRAGVVAPISCWASATMSPTPSIAPA